MLQQAIMPSTFEDVTQRVSVDQRESFGSILHHKRQPCRWDDRGRSSSACNEMECGISVGRRSSILTNE
jgi:hypothetical protein